MIDCIFCKIIEREIPSNKIYENKYVLAFLDINPVSRGHTLVIPKNHCLDIFDMNENDAKEVMIASKRIASGMMKGLGAAGVNLVNSNKKVAGQEVFHYHMHVIPRYDNDGITFRSVYENKFKENDFKATSEKIKRGL